MGLKGTAGNARQSAQPRKQRIAGHRAQVAQPAQTGRKLGKCQRNRVGRAPVEGFMVYDRGGDRSFDATDNAVD